MSAIEGVSTPVCAVYWPEDVGALWHGTYGTAKVHKGEPMAVLSSGERIAL